MRKLICRSFLILILTFSISSVLKAQVIQRSIVNMQEISDREKMRPPLEVEAGNKNAEEDEEKFDPIPLLEAPPGSPVFRQNVSNRQSPSDEGANSLPQRTARGAVLQTFQGINDDTYFDLVNAGNFRTIPPDVMGAVGPSHVMTVHNNKYRVTDKAGTQLTYVDAQAFWNGTTGYGTTGNLAKGHSDPHVLYNHYQNRWMLIAQSNLDGGSALMVAVSTTNDPTGTWSRYIIDVDAANVNGFDYPLLGFNQNWLVVTGNLFPLAGGAAVKNQIYIFDIANLVAGGALSFSGGGANAQLIESLQSAQSGWECSLYSI